MNLPDDYTRFHNELMAKMQRGHEEYGDVSFSREPAELIEELQHECLDMAGWGYILWHRLERMKKAL